ncbi:UNVERIFIED_CONTAM: hypothetical protein FKN15_043145 [Acipenser sinensis]
MSDCNRGDMDWPSDVCIVLQEEGGNPVGFACIVDDYCVTCNGTDEQSGSGVFNMHPPMANADSNTAAVAWNLKIEKYEEWNHSLYHSELSPQQ